jgi:predicted RND superfamily exporter protein
LILGPELLFAQPQSPPNFKEQIRAMQEFLVALDAYLAVSASAPTTETARKLKQDLTMLMTRIENEPSDAQQKRLSRLQNNLFHSFAGRMQALETSLEAEIFTREDLPPELAERWRSADNIYRVEAFPAEDLNDDAASRGFVEAVRAIAPEAIGLPVIYLDAGDAVVRAFQIAFILALAAIAVLLFILLRPKTDVLLILFPLLLAGLFTGAASVLLNIPFNFANIIALPLLLGFGVDNSIHMVHRMRMAPPENGQILKTSTARAVLFSSLTTISSFGNLAFSPHRGMASMGIMLTFGIGFTIVCTLVVLPAFIEAYIHKGAKR